MRSKRTLLLSFLIPPLLLGAAFALSSIFPFGGRQFIIHDCLHQYYPFASELQMRLQQGQSLLWTWNLGMGSNFVSLYAYYLSSPLNLLLAFVPMDYLSEAFTLFLLIRVGLAGLFFSVLIRRTLGQSGLSAVIFSMVYALSGFTLGYYWNVMWLDTFALTPLVVAGTVSLLRDKKPILYTVSLALAVWCNFMMGLYVCIFVLLVFILLCILDKTGPKAFLSRLIRIAVYSLLAIGMTALITLPAFLSLENIYRDPATSPNGFAWFTSFIDILGNFATASEPAVLDGLPNLFSTMLSVMLLGVFWRSRAISRREKLLFSALLAFLVISLNANLLYYAWNGFTMTNLIPYRFTFLITLMLAFMGCYAFEKTEKPVPADLVFMGLSGAAVVLCAALGPQGTKAVVASLIAMAAYLPIMALYASGKLQKHAVTICLLVAVIVEIGVTANVSVETVGTTQYANYPFRYESVQMLLSEMRSADPDDFYRVDMSVANAALTNNPVAYHYPGVSTFSSVANYNVTQFMKKLGVSVNRTRNKYLYLQATPMADAFLNMKYFISPDGVAPTDTQRWTPAFEKDGATLYQNEDYLAVGFMVRPEILDYQGSQTNGFASQAELLSLATGVSGDLFAPIEGFEMISNGIELSQTDEGAYTYTYQPEIDSFPFVAWDFEFPEDGAYYAWLDVTNARTARLVFGRSMQQIMLPGSAMIPLGEHVTGESAMLTVQIAEPDGDGVVPLGSANLLVSRMNEDLFRQSYAALQDEQMVVTAHSDTEITGTIHALSDGLLYTSIPYEKGWDAYVDGEKAEILPLDGAMLCVSLPAGEHVLRFTYTPNGLVTGAVISSGCLLAFAALYILRRKKK